MMGRIDRDKFGSLIPPGLPGMPAGRDGRPAMPGEA